MCGIFGYIGKQNSGKEIIIEGIHRLEHRGYDSMGMACIVNGLAELYKISKEESENLSAWDLKGLIPDLKSRCTIGIGHTRWATFGSVTQKNAHPHCDTTKEFFVVHNGNLDNYTDIKTEITKTGVSPYSETDTELICHLLAKYYEGDLEKAVKRTVKKIDGANSILVMSVKHPDKLVAANKGGSILLGKAEDCVVVTSDPSAFSSFTIENRIALNDNEIAVIKNDGWKIQSEKKQKELDEQVLYEDTGLDLGAYNHHMEKEIFEQPFILENTIRGRLYKEQGISQLGGIDDVARELRNVNAFHFVGCGTAYNACCYASLLFNRFGIPSRAWIASEFCYSHPVFDPNDAFVFISQSGETADTIAVINEIKVKGNICLGIVNVPGSRISRETDAGIYLRAGKETGVASTKAFTSQLMASVLLTLFLARQRKMTVDTGERIIEHLQMIPDKILEVFKQAEEIKRLVKKYSTFHNYYFLGRYFSSIVAQEGALKLKEISYIHAESYPLGEMKHGPLALVDPEFCSFVIIPEDTVYRKGIVNISEIKAREGKVIAITTEGNKSIEKADDIIYVPQTLDYLSPLLTTIPLQLFAYYMAIEFGFNPDKPRNLAKTVTVE